MAVTVDISCFSCKLWWLQPLGEACVGYIVLDYGPLVGNLLVSFKYIFFLFKLLFFTNEIIIFSKMLGSHEKLCVISLNISLEEIIFVNCYIYIMWIKLFPKRSWTVAKNVHCHQPLASSHRVWHTDFLWEAMWRNEKMMGLRIRNSLIYKTYSKLIKLSGIFFLICIQRIIAFFLQSCYKKIENQ